MIEIPKRAVAEWLALADGLATFKPSCAFDPDAWHEIPRDWSRERQAAHRAEISAICALCPLIEPCNRYADKAREKDGCWAGRWRDDELRQAYRARREAKLARAKAA